MDENAVCSGEIILDINSMSFDMYQPKDMKNLKVASIKSTCEALDAMGAPVPGGLHDPSLGPIAETELCGTCNQSYAMCPGHLGILRLPAVIVNPIFIRTVLELLRCMCFSCHRLRAQGHEKLKFMYQKKALDNEALSLLHDINSVVEGTRRNFNNEMSQDQKLATVFTALQEKLKEELLALDDHCERKASKGMQLIEDMLHKKFVLDCTSEKSCPRCKTVAKQVLCMGSNYITVKKKFEQNHIDAIKKEDDDIEDGYNDIDRNDEIGEMKAVEEEEEHPSKDSQGKKRRKPAKEYIQIHRGQIRDYFRELFKEEDGILRRMYPILDRNDMEHPTDIFFLTHLPVPPPKTRPPMTTDFMARENCMTMLYRAILKACRPVEILNRVVNQKNLTEMEQLLEKKEGLFRQNMMGKRVNFAARSVITPDPYLNIDEIGIPFCFATALSFPERVTPQNLSKLQKMVMNGSHVYPGAVSVQLRPGEEKFIGRVSEKGREAIAEKLKQHLAKNKDQFIPVVRRHVLDGDPLLVNRQPTLHRPSIMSHRARILPRDRTFRLHYANCKAYNADFDGDEMNIHYPQSDMARSEAACLADVCHNYLVPKDGSPLSGLIQDHVVAGIKLAVRGRFFNMDEYQRLLSITTWGSTRRVKLLPPTIWKPEVLWSGKQVISTLLLNLIPDGKPLICMRSKAKVPHKEWGGEGGTDMGESEVVIRQGELLQGVLDKQQYGASAYGLVHSFYELYGPHVGGKLLSKLSHLFTFFLQTEGFTIGIADVLVAGRANRQRRKIMNQCQKIGQDVAARAFDLQWNRTTEEEVKKSYEMAHMQEDKSLLNHLDATIKKDINTFTSTINRKCVPAGLIKKFPSNNLQLMVQSGAKGSTVNTMQISALLGQIELEGKRPPLMLSGRSLPSFPPYDTSPRARGFIDGRFLTGIRPQEFFFHCMAGREGLIDTAVKTSASGYLQRCIIKNLEGLIIGYDMTVRDSDNSIIQFNYGEDGLDVCKDQYLNKNMFPFLKENGEGMLDEDVIDRLMKTTDQESIDNKKSEISRLRNKYKGIRCEKRMSAFIKFCEEQEEVMTKEQLVRMWSKLSEKRKARFKKKIDKFPDPVISSFNQQLTMGAVSERLEDTLEEYVEKASDDDKQDVRTLIYHKALQSMVTPGDAVGILAAQSIGEPSTQMTLNTFHFAGRGEMNVTLGIPRLRELLMVASKTVKTPTMEIPIRDGFKSPFKQAKFIKEKLTKVTLADVLEDIDVRERHNRRGNSKGSRYIIRFNLSPNKEFGVTNKSTLRFLEASKSGKYKGFFSVLVKSIIKKPDKTPTLHISGAAAGGFSSKKSEKETEEEQAGQVPEVEDLEEERAMQEDQDEMEIDYDDEEEEAVNDGEGDAVDGVETLQDGGENETIVDEEFLPSRRDSRRKEEVLYQDDHIVDYKFDQKHDTWCQVTIQTKITAHKPDLTSLLKELASKMILRYVPNIQRAFIAEEGGGQFIIRTEGTCFQGLHRYSTILDLAKLKSNDVHFMAEHFGIEAANSTLRTEIKRVFGVYGITVNPRHLSLIADYMTWEGAYRPLNRTGIISQPSFAQKATFETTSRFILNAILSREQEPMRSPSACLLMGQPCKVGTGTFSILHRL